MGLDYSYSQPSSSEEYEVDVTFLLQEEAAMYANEAESSQNVGEPFQYPSQPEADDGIPTRCYCGAEPIVATLYTSKYPGRRYFSCENADDGNCHVWKWWDVAVMEEMYDFQRQLHVTDQKVAKLEETVGVCKEKSVVRDGVLLVVCVLLSVVVLICTVVMFKWVAEKDNVITEYLEELQRMRSRGSDL